MTAERDHASPPPLAAQGPASAWPSTLPAGESVSPSRVSGFDPLAYQRRRAAQQLAARLDLCRPALALRLTVAVQAAAALVAWIASDGPIDALLRLAPLALAAITGCLLWLPAMCALRAWLPRRGAAMALAAAAGLGAVAGVAGGLQAALWSAWLPTPWTLAGAAACGAAVAAAAWVWLGLRAAGARPVEADVRLAELQSRIRPHFLFNALNTALVLVRVDPARAEEVLEDLAELFRAALAEAGASVTLDEEIDLAQRYLAIEKLRYGDRLQVAWELDPAAAPARLPPLVLQPLVENAVRHGIEPLPGGGRVVVHTFVRRGLASVWITNSAPDAAGPPGSGMALSNVRERLRLLHDLAGSLEVWREPGLFHVRLSVPLP
jgi:two-component system sensor histidine kinase AlgZ